MKRYTPQRVPIKMVLAPFGSYVLWSDVEMRMNDLQRKLQAAYNMITESAHKRMEMKMEYTNHILQFLKRSDIRVGLGDNNDIVVHHKYWWFEGRASNVIAAAKLAITAEQCTLDKIKKGWLK